MAATLPKAQTILVVDDDVSTRAAMAALLREAGYDILTAGNVPSALQILVEHQPDLLITDVRLDAYNGLHLIAMAPRPIPAIVVTGFADPTIEADARRLGAEYLTKPVSIVALRGLVSRMLERTPAQSVFMRTRRAPRQRLASPVSVRIRQQLGSLVEVSAIGVRLELHGGDGTGELPDLLPLQIVSSAMTVPVRVAWKRRQNAGTWVCGATIAPEDQARWQAFVTTLH